MENNREPRFYGIMEMLNDFQEKRLQNLCPFCGKTVGEFRDALSEKEFSISGLCQECQDKFFTED
jgi:hypothetical protein